MAGSDGMAGSDPIGSGGADADAGGADSGGADSGGAAHSAGAAGADASGAGAAGAAGADSGVERVWSDAELIELADVSVGPPAVAFGEPGNATALWWHDVSGAPDRMMSTSFDGASSWGTPAPIDQLGAGASGDPDIALGSDGDGFAVWAEFNNAVRSIRASRRVAGAWQPAVFIETVDTGSARLPKVAVNDSGDAVAVWIKDGDASAATRYDTWANYYTAGIGWGTAVPIETDDTGGAEAPQVAIDQDGNVIAVWAQRDATQTKNIWANRRTAAGWGTAGLLEISSSNADDPQVALEASGDAIVVWSSSHIWSRSYTVLTNSWGPVEQVSSQVTTRMPTLGFDAGGHAMAVWSQEGNGDPGSIWANRYTSGTGWAAAVPVKSNVTSSANLPDLAVSAGGDAFATWVEHDGVRNDIWCSRYVAGETWGEAQLLELSDGDAYYPEVAVDENGEAVAVWRQFDGVRDSIYASRFR